MSVRGLEIEDEDVDVGEDPGVSGRVGDGVALLSCSRPFCGACRGAVVTGHVVVARELAKGLVYNVGDALAAEVCEGADEAPALRLGGVVVGVVVADVDGVDGVRTSFHVPCRDFGCGLGVGGFDVAVCDFEEEFEGDDAF